MLAEIEEKFHLSIFVLSGFGIGRFLLVQKTLEREAQSSQAGSLFWLKNERIYSLSNGNLFQ